MTARHQDGRMSETPPEESLRALLIELRRAALIQVDAYNRFLGGEPRDPRPKREPLTRIWRNEEEPDCKTA